MPLWLQHLLVFTLVGACCVYIGWQAVRSLWGKRSRLGSCCAKGCSSAQSAASSTQKIHFLPADMLRKRR
ncbi:MAG TPA: hypothetical protein VH475_18090 [Tepidisphaeraceae bacterium]|jgi:hypothetical protein